MAATSLSVPALLKHTKVTKILIKNNVAVGVEVVTMGNERKTIKANLEVILSSGAFNSPQLLMLSGIGPREHLKSFNIRTLKNLPVGFNLQDHTSALIFHQTEPLNLTSKTNPLEPQLRFLNGFVALNKCQKYPDAQFLLLSTKGSLGLFNMLPGYNNDIYTEAMKFTSREILINTIMNLIPVSRGRLMLNSANTNDKPKIYLGALNSKLDVDKTIRLIKEYLRIESSTYFKSVNAERLDLTGDRCTCFTPGSDEYWECYVRCFMASSYHYCGTCAMGTVVDARLRVLGIKKLRVVDVSVFPIIPSGPILAPTIMTAEKAADMIKEDNNMKVVRNKG